MVDLDGDGLRDVISGSYWPGDLYIFRGRKGGSFAKGETIRAASGRNLNGGPLWESERTPQMDSLAAAPYAADLDGDGDLDMLIGNIAGRVMLIPNTGSAAAPKFDDAKRAAIEAGGEPIEVPGGDAGPTVADWDRDGDLDLVVGAGDGSVWLYRNEGKPTEPRFSAGVALIAASPYGHGENPTVGDTLRGIGSRTKPHVADVDLDGWPDLLVGDFLMVMRPEPDLDERQIAERDRLREERDAVNRTINERFATLEAEGKQADPESDPELAQAFEEANRVHEALSDLEPTPEMHGYVWYFRRIPGEAGVAAR